jgi:hypothetical protein
MARFNPVEFWRETASAKPLSIAAPPRRRTSATTPGVSGILPNIIDKFSGPFADYIKREMEKERAAAARGEMQGMISALTERGGQRAYDAVTDAPMDMDEMSSDVDRDAGIAFDEPGGMDAVRGLPKPETSAGQGMLLALMHDEYRQRQVREEAELAHQRAIELRRVPSGTGRRDTQSAPAKNWEKLQEIKKEFPQIRNADGKLEDSPEVRVFKNFVRASQIKDQGATFGRYNVGRGAMEPVGKKTLPPAKQPENIAAAKKAEQTAAGIAERMQARVESGSAAARIAPTIRRSLELLKTVKTGGFSNFALRAKQLIGVEGADEGELSQNLGKAVLSQLRATFGAAFTAKEGAELKQIEAGFGKSVAANKRMLQNLMKFTERFYQQGLAAATDMDDLSSVKSMRELYNLKLGGDVEPPVTSSPTPKVNPTLEEILEELRKRGLKK